MRRTYSYHLGMIAALALNLSFAVAAFAADLGARTPAPVYTKAPPPSPTWTWTGIYLGINGGWGWGTTNHTDELNNTTGNFGTNGGVVGVTYGANWQTGPFVLGFEGDFDYANINGTLTNPAKCSVNGGTTCFTNLNDFGTDRVRAGFDASGWLLYGTGGVGYGQVNAGQNPCGLTAFGGNSCNEEWRVGWVAGGGVEKIFAPHWSAKIEYLHFDLGNTKQYTPTTIGGGNFVNVLERGDMVRVGVNYKFDFLH